MIQSLQGWKKFWWVLLPHEPNNLGGHALQLRWGHHLLPSLRHKMFWISWELELVLYGELLARGKMYLCPYGHRFYPRVPGERRELYPHMLSHELTVIPCHSPCFPFSSKSTWYKGIWGWPFWDYKKSNYTFCLLQRIAWDHKLCLNKCFWSTWQWEEPRVYLSAWPFWKVGVISLGKQAMF